MKITREHLKKLLEVEGGYACDPNDKGGETIFGVSRKYNPNWPGWAVVDSYKINGKFPHQATDLVLLEVEADLMKLYQSYANFIKVEDEEWAYRIFDFAVNTGVGNAKKLLKKTKDADSWKQNVIEFYIEKGKKYPYWRFVWQSRLRKIYKDRTITL